MTPAECRLMGDLDLLGDLCKRGSTNIKPADSRYDRGTSGGQVKCGGLKMDQARRMKELEKENARLRRAVSDLTLDRLILQEASKGNF